MRTVHALPALLLSVAACSSSSSDNPAPQPDAGADAGNGPLTLHPGEVADVDVTDGTGGIKLATSGAAESYVLVLASTKLDDSSTLTSWSLSTDGAPDGAHASPAAGCSITADAWRTVQVPAETPPSGTAVAQGTKKTIHMQTDTGAEDIDVEAITVGKSAVVWKDVTAAHPATLDDAFVSQFLADFENTILPRERSVFGVESDLDGDGHIALVFTPLTYKTAVAFFSSCDLQQKAGCPAYNGGEYLYLTPPNAIDPPYNTPNAIKEILTHELSHLIHFNRKVLRNKAPAWTDSSYMVEGVGGFAQDVIGPQAGNLYVTMAGLDGITNFSLSDLFVDGTLYDKPRDGVLRGGGALFVRWLYDRAGGDTAKPDGTIEGHGGPAFVRALLEPPDSIAKVLPTAAKADLTQIALDFYTTLAMSNRDEAGGVAPANGCFAYLPTQKDPVTNTQRGADVFASFHGMQMKGPATTKATSGKLRSGGVTYVDLPAPDGQTELDLTVTLDPKALPRVRIGRIK